MVAPPIEHSASAPRPGEEADDEEYESDVYDVEEDEEDVDYEGEEDDDDEDEDEEERGASLTALLVSDPSKAVDEDEDDEVYAPAASDEKVPATAHDDGNVHLPVPDRLSEVEDSLNAKGATSVPTAVGIKRKTSGDEQESSGEEDEESDAKKLKS